MNVLFIYQRPLSFQAEKVLEKLLEWYNNSKKRKRFNSVTYVSEVWLPEVGFIAVLF